MPASAAIKAVAARLALTRGAGAFPAGYARPAAGPDQLAVDGGKPSQGGVRHPFCSELDGTVSRLSNFPKRYVWREVHSAGLGSPAPRQAGMPDATQIE